MNNFSRPQLVNGGTYDLGSAFGIYREAGDVFVIGNCFIPRFDTIYSGSADPLYLRGLRDSEIARNLDDASALRSLARLEDIAANQ